VPWHFIFESLAYAVAFRMYVASRARQGDFLSTNNRWTIVAAAIAGAAIGAKVLFWFEDPPRTFAHGLDFAYLMSGKTIVGALLGGTLAVELTKRLVGIHRRTGDLFAIPLCIGIAIGRLGCYAAGLQDDTYGLPTHLPWGHDFGDGIPRHPVQIYESLAMLGLALALRYIRVPPFRDGDRFRVFLFSYCSWRLLVDFLKPGIAFAGFTVLQWCCALAALIYAKDILRMTRRTYQRERTLTHV
jgi:prolipoprotein diacylglyceryltransferase